MARLLITTLSLLLEFIAQAQNIGIGTTIPRAKLHVFAGASGNTSPFSPLVVESNSHTYINLLSPDANETSILFGKASDAASGGIIYNSVNTPNGLQFRTNGNLIRMVVRNNGNVGIGTMTPNVPLGFPPSLGKKITLYPGASGDVGFAVQGNLLQMYSDNPNADIAFGYDQAGTFTERFRMKANGAFVVNGYAGTAGQVLQTNGDGAVPTWTSPTNLLYSNTIMLLNNTSTLLTSNAFVQIPGLIYAFTAVSNTKVLINFSITVFPVFCVACGPTGVYIDINLDGSVAKRFLQDFVNVSGNTFSGTMLLDVSPGSHTIYFTTSRIGPNVNVGNEALASHAILQIIPQ